MRLTRARAMLVFLKYVDFWPKVYLILKSNNLQYDTMVPSVNCLIDQASDVSSIILDRLKEKQLVASLDLGHSKDFC